MTPDDCDVVQRRTITHDAPSIVRDHRNLTNVSRRMASYLFIYLKIFILEDQLHKSILTWCPVR